MLKALHYGTILAVICFAPPALAADFLPECAGLLEIANARVTRVEKNGVLVLNNGRAVLLEGFSLPLGDDNASPDLANQALTALAEMTVGEPMILTAIVPKEDRYDRIRAQGFGRRWIQIALLEQGLARVALVPDRGECAQVLYEAESRARTKRLGLWASDFAPRILEVSKDRAASFLQVDGWVTNVGQVAGGVFIDFGSEGQPIYSATIAPQDRSAFRGYDLDGLQTKHIRVRGNVQYHRGRA
jgi:micrococcal nuclease